MSSLLSWTTDPAARWAEWFQTSEPDGWSDRRYEWEKAKAKLNICFHMRVLGGKGAQSTTVKWVGASNWHIPDPGPVNSTDQLLDSWRGHGPHCFILGGTWRSTRLGCPQYHRSTTIRCTHTDDARELVKAWVLMLHTYATYAYETVQEQPAVQAFIRGRQPWPLLSRNPNGHCTNACKHRRANTSGHDEALYISKAKDTSGWLRTCTDKII